MEVAVCCTICNMPLSQTSGLSELTSTLLCLQECCISHCWLQTLTACCATYVIYQQCP